MASIRKRGQNSYLIVVSRGYDYEGNRLKAAQKTVHPPKDLTPSQCKKWLNEQAVLFEREVRHDPQAGEPDGNAWQADGHGQTGETVPRNIGRIVLADIEPGWKAEIWRIYIGDTALRGKGYGKEAMLAMMEYCFGQLGLERLYLDHYTGNPAAYLYLSLGFQYEGVLRKNCRKNGVLYDVHLMSMLREEYEERYGKR